MSEESVSLESVIVLEVVEPDVEPDYEVHGKATCVSCDEWCWLGDESLKVVQQGIAVPLCLPCANKAIPRDGSIQPTRRVEDTRRGEGH